MIHPRQQSPEKWAAALGFAQLERQHGLPAGVLVNLVRQESGGDCEILGPVTRSGERAKGLCQFMPKTAAGMGVDSGDPVSSINGAARYLEQLMDMFGGDPQKAIAAYNWGPGNMRKALAAHPTDWKNYLPAETKNYLAVVGKGIGHSFVERQTAGEEISEADLRTEESRRRARLNDAGIFSAVPIEKLLGNFFFALMEMFEKCFARADDGAAPVRVDVPPVAMSVVRSVQASVPSTPTRG